MTLLGRVPILLRQDMNSKSGEEQKKGHHVRKSTNFDSKFGAEQKKVQSDNALMLGRVSINTRTRPSIKVLGLDSAHPYWPYCKLKLCIILACQCKEKLRCTFHFLNCVTRTMPFFTVKLNRQRYKPVLKYFLLERTQTEPFQFI